MKQWIQVISQGGKNQTGLLFRSMEKPSYACGLVVGQSKPNNASSRCVSFVCRGVSSQDVTIKELFGVIEIHPDSKGQRPGFRLKEWQMVSNITQRK